MQVFLDFFMKNSRFWKYEYTESDFYSFFLKKMSEADYKLKVWLEAENQIDQSKIKKELKKTWESAGEGMAQGFEKKKDTFLSKVKKFGQAGKKELDKDLVADLKLNKVHLQHQLDDLRSRLKAAKKANQKELEYEIRLKIDETQTKLNETTASLKKLWKAGSWVRDMLIGLAGKLGIWFGIAQAVQYVIKTFNQFQESQKILVQATGASGKVLKELSEVVLSLQSSVNQAQTEIAAAVGEVNTRLGLTGKELENVTENYLKFATVTGQDGKEAIAENIRLFNIWNIEASKHADYLDQLAFAGQAMGIDVKNLTKNLTDSQVALEQLGFSLTDSIALLSNFEKEGVNAEQALSAMQRGVSGLVKAGMDPADALNQLIDQIKNASSESEGLRLALELFGERGGQSAFNAIRRGAFDIASFSQQLENAQGTVGETHKNMETFGEWISRVWSGIWGEFVANVNEGFSLIGEQVMRVKWLIGEFFDEVGKGISIIGEVIRGERDRTLAMTEKGEAIQKQKNLQEEINAINRKYDETLSKTNAALEKFSKISIDDSATREEFEASRQQALATVEAFREVLKAKIALGTSVNAWLDQTSKEYKQNMKEIQSAQQSLKEIESIITNINNTKYTGTGKKKKNWSGGIWGGGKSDPIKTKKEELRKMRDLEIQAVMESSDIEFVKQAKLYDIKKAYEKKEMELEWKTNNELLKTAEQFLKDYYEKKLKTSQDEQKLTNDAIKKAEDYKKTIEKVAKAWSDLKEQAKDSLRSIKHEIEEMDQSFAKDLGARFIEVQQQLKENEKNNEGLKWISEHLDTAIIQRWKDVGQTEVNDVDIDLVLEQFKLKEELLLLEQKTTEEQREQAKLLSEQSETQKMIARYEEERQQKVEHQSIVEALSWAEDLSKEIIKIEWDVVSYYDKLKDDYVVINDFKNQEYARDLHNQQAKLNLENQQAETHLKEQLKIIETHSNKVVTQWQNDTKAYQLELDKRKLAVQQYVADVQRMLSSVPSAHRAWGGELSNGKVALVGEHGPEQIIARASSYVQPRNAVTNHSVVNTTTSQNYNLNMGDAHFWPFATVDDLLAALKSKLTYHF